MCGRSKLCFWNLTSFHFVSEALDCSSGLLVFFEELSAWATSSACITNQKIFSKGLAIISLPQKKKNLLFGILFTFLLLFNPFDSNISLMQFTFLFHLYWENYACLIYYIYLRIHVILGFFNYIKYTNYYMQYSCTSVLCNKTPCVS